MDPSRTAASSVTASHSGSDHDRLNHEQKMDLNGNGEAAATTAKNSPRGGGEASFGYDEAENKGSSKQGASFWMKLQSRCSETITHDESTYPLAWQALLTGMVDALIYARSTIWTGFQTGNMVQFSQNIAQYMLPQAEKFPLLTVERALSIWSFLLGSYLGAKGGARWGDKKRGWQASSAVIQSIFLFGASAILLSRPEGEAPSFRYWPGVIIMTAFSMGMQSIAAQKLISPAFATTVAFTATLTQIASDPYLFALSLSPLDKYRNKKTEKRRNEGGIEEAEYKPRTLRTLGRDRRLLGIFSLCVGAGVAECLLYSRAGLSGGLTIAAGFKLIQALLWVTIPQGRKASQMSK